MLYICNLILRQMNMFYLMKLFLAACLFLALTGIQNSIFSQSLSGSIKSSSTISFASVSVKGSPIGTSSDISGKYLISDLPVGEYEIIFSAIGYKKRKENIVIKEGENILNVQLEPYSYDIDQVVVTGTMKESFRSASPVKVDVITQAFLKKIATSNVMEVIDNVNGVQKQVNCGVCGTNDIHINGMEGPYTLVLINGMPIMSSLSTVYALNGIPTSLIKQIEIIKGPSSTLYGTEAVAGVINVITKESADVSLLEFDAFITSHKEKNIDFTYAPKMKKVNMLFSGNFFHMNHFLDDNNDNFSDVPFSERLSLFNHWNVKRKTNKDLSISVKYYKEDRNAGEKTWNESLRGNDSIYGESIYTNRVEVIGTYEFPTQEDIRIDASYNYHHQDSYYGNTKFEAIQNIYFANLLWNKKGGNKHDILTGLTYRYQTFVDSTLAKIDEKKFIPALFVQDEIQLSKNWATLLGIRGDHHQNHGFILSPRFNLKWNPVTHTAIRLNAGTGFRLVNLFTEDHAFLTGTRDVQVLENLQPEQSYNINLNINHIFCFSNSSATIDFDAFYTRFSNKIIPDYNTDPNKIIYANLDSYSISRGFALNFHQNFEFPLNFKVGTTFLDVYSAIEQNIKEKELFVPTFSSVFSLTYTYDKLNTSIDWTGKLMGPMLLPAFPEPFERAEQSPWFSQHHVQIRKVFCDNFSIYAGIKNIFNYTQESPLIDWQNPFGDNFDTSYAYGPLQSRRLLFGLKAKL